MRFVGKEDILPEIVYALPLVQFAIFDSQLPIFG